MSVCAHQDAGRQVIDLHYNPDAISQDQAQRLMELFAARIDNTLSAAVIWTAPLPSPE